MATSGLVATRFILQHTHTQRLLPVLCSNLTSKASSVRRESYELLDMVSGR